MYINVKSNNNYMTMMMKKKHVQKHVQNQSNGNNIPGTGKYKKE